MNQSRITMLNLLGMVGMAVVLLIGLIAQVTLNELPCPLCLLQRAGFALAMFGFMLNVVYGIKQQHYGVVLLGADVYKRQVYRTAADEKVEQIDFDPFASPWRPLSTADGGAIGKPASPEVSTAGHATSPELPYDFRAATAAIEQTWLRSALEAQGWHQGHTAQALGLGYDQLRHLIRKYGLQAANRDI